VRKRSQLARFCLWQSGILRFSRVWFSALRAENHTRRSVSTLLPQAKKVAQDAE